MNAKAILINLFKRFTSSGGVYRVDCGKYTIFFRDAIMNHGIEDLVVGLTTDICTTCRGEGETPSCQWYFPCGSCKGEGFK